MATALVSVAVVPVLCLFVRSSGRVRAESAASRSGASLPVAVAFAAVAALVLGAVALMDRMPRDLVPNEDFGVVLVDVKTKDGTSRPQVVETVRKILGKVSAVCDIEKSCTVFGEGIFSPSGENTAKMYLVLKPWSERGAREGTQECIARMREAVSDIPEAQISLLSLPTVPGMGTAAYVSPLVLSTADNDPVRLSYEAHRLQAILKRSPLADDVTCGYNTDSPHLRIHVDRAKCELMKVPLSSLFATLQHNLGSVYVNDVNLGVPVTVNVENSVAAMAVALLNGVEAEELRSGLDSFRGVKRRFDVQMKTDKLTVIDDYAHHPAELEASIRSVMELYRGKKVLGVFQPHLYTRTKDFYREFAAALSLLDEAMLVELYPAREEPIEGISSETIYNEVTCSKTLTTKKELISVLKTKRFDVLLTLGAGDLDTMLPQICEALR